MSIKNVFINGKQYINLNEEEILILNAALNEVCNGIDLFEFETRIGASHENATKLSKKLLSLIDEIKRQHS